MIYGYLTEWMVKENPSFAREVARYYSIEHGRRKAAVEGELANWQAAEQIVNRNQPKTLPVLLRLWSARARAGRAVREGDEGFLHSLREVVRLSRKSKHDEKNPRFIEYIFEAYYFLRKRDGEGSPLPPKQKVKNTAAIIAAFQMEGLTAKLSAYLWHRPKSKLTDDEFRRVEGVRKSLLDERDHNWTQRLAEAGLGNLPRKYGKK
jgi:hypothetical protein